MEKEVGPQQKKNGQPVSDALHSIIQQIIKENTKDFLDDNTNDLKCALKLARNYIVQVVANRELIGQRQNFLQLNTIFLREDDAHSTKVHALHFIEVRLTEPLSLLERNTYTDLQRLLKYPLPQRQLQRIAISYLSYADSALYKHIIP